MRFQPYYQYLTGLGEREWNELTPEQHRELIRASKQKPAKPPAVEKDEDKEPSWLPTLFPVRRVTLEQLRGMPRFELYW